MSSAMVSAAAAQGRLFFSDTTVPEVSSPSGKILARVQRNDPPLTENDRFSYPKLNDAKLNDPRLAGVTSASRLGVRPAPEMLPSGIAAINALTGGWPRGCLTEICGPASSGRTTLLLAALAAATRRGEFCVLVDASDALDPQSVADAGVDLDRLLWVRCGENSLQSSPRRHSDAEKNFSRTIQNSADQSSEDRIASPSAKRQTEHRLEQVLHATDLLLESGGFGLVVLDLSDLPPQQARRIPLTTWFRFRRAIEHTPTVLLAAAQQPIAGSCSSLLLQLGSKDSMPADGLTFLDKSSFVADESAAKRRKNAAHSLPRACRGGVSRGLDVGVGEAPEGRKKICLTGKNFPYPAHAHLLTELDITAELIHSRLERKPARSIAFASKTAWAG